MRNFKKFLKKAKKAFTNTIVIGIIFILVVAILSLNPRLKNFDISFKTTDIELNTKAEFETQQEKAVNDKH